MDLLKSVHIAATNIEALVESVRLVFARQRTPFSLYELEADPNAWGRDPEIAKRQAAENRYAKSQQPQANAQQPGTAGGTPKVAPPPPSIPVSGKTIVIVSDKVGNPRHAGVFKGDQRGAATLEFGDQQTNHDKGFDVPTNNIRAIQDDDAKVLRTAAETLRQKNPNKPVMVVQMKQI
jgi:hypothetical protein